MALAAGQRPGPNGAGILLLGEAKATPQLRTPGDIERLERIRQLLTTEGHRAEGATLAVLSLTGFSPELEQLAAQREDVLLVGIDALYGR